YEEPLAGSPPSGCLRLHRRRPHPCRPFRQHSLHRSFTVGAAQAFCLLRIYDAPGLLGSRPNAAELRKRGVDHRGFALLRLVLGRALLALAPRRPRIGDNAAVPRPCQGRGEGASRLSRLAVDGSPAPEEGRAGKDQLWAARKRANEETPTTKRSPAIGRLDVRPAQPWRPPGWRNCWRAALLAASILSSSFLLTQTKGEKETVIKMDTEHPEEGGSVTFTPVDLDVENLNTFIWYRGEIEESSRIFTYILVPTRIQNNGPSFTERETGGLDSSLSIRDLWLNDSGLYTLAAKVSSGTVIGLIVINVLDVEEADSHPQASIFGIILGCMIGIVAMGGLGLFLYPRFHSAARRRLHETHRDQCFSVSVGTE
ncbi:uncharacterized protein LOC114603348, partial [Podarcis muralis]